MLAIRTPLKYFLRMWCSPVFLEHANHASQNPPANPPANPVNLRSALPHSQAKHKQYERAHRMAECVR